MAGKSKSKEDQMATTNAPNKPDDTTRNMGGKTEINKTEGGTESDNQRTREGFIASLGADKAQSPSQEDTEKMEKLLHKTETTENGRTVLTSSISAEDADKVNANPLISTEPVNFTKDLTGVAGNLDLTQGGRLNGDKSVRVNKTIEEINAEIEKTSGPNPTPNRDGNELLKATNGITGALLLGIDANTDAMANELKEMLKKDRLDKDDKDKLSKIEQQLRNTGKVMA